MLYQEKNRGFNQLGIVTSDVAERVNLLLLACVISGLLLFLMHEMVSVSQPYLKDATVFKLTKMIYVPEETGLITTDPTSLRKVISAPVIQYDVVDHTTVDIQGITLTPDFVPTSIDSVEGLSSGGEATKVTPSTIIYPTRAQQKGLCGWAVVQFNITESGVVSNAVVVESSNSVFDRASIQSVMKDRYKPQTHSGRGVEVIGKQVKIVYELESGC